MIAECVVPLPNVSRQLLPFLLLHGLQLIKASFRSSRVFSLKMLCDRDTNKCFDKDITEYLDKYHNKRINKYKDKLI